jgi:hypothetical protein
MFMHALSALSTNLSLQSEINMWAKQKETKIMQQSKREVFQKTQWRRSTISRWYLLHWLLERSSRSKPGLKFSEETGETETQIEQAASGCEWWHVFGVSFAIAVSCAFLTRSIELIVWQIQLEDLWGRQEAVGNRSDEIARGHSNIGQGVKGSVGEERGNGTSDAAIQGQW